MDAYDASKMILTRIQSLDPENASKIMGYILIQDFGDKELIRLAHGPENNLVLLINKAKIFLGFSQKNHFNFPRIIVPNVEKNNGFCSYNHGEFKSPNLYCNNNNVFSRKNNCEGLSLSSTDLVKDEFHGTLSHPVIMSPSGRSDNDHFAPHDYNCDEFMKMCKTVPLAMPQGSCFDNASGGSDSVVWKNDDHFGPHGSLLHRRSSSVNDACLFEDRESGGQNGNLLGGWRPCMYFARGFCKNGGSCKFSHSFDASNGDVAFGGSLKSMEEFEWLRMKAIQQQKLAAAAASEFMASSPRHSFPYRRSGAAALMGEEFQKFGPCGPDINNFPGLGLDCNSSSRQIYLTFPADSAFTEEDVSNYFSIYGPVQDVRIPYQQKRMFGFVTFLYAETVNLILAKGNPHFVCDYRVLVKPYKEKGKVAEKKRQQQLFDAGESPACLSPTGFDVRESYDLPFGGKALYNAKEMILKNQLDEQAELQQAIELQGRRLMNMHLMELKNNYNNHQRRPSFPPAFPLTPRRQTHHHQLFQNQNFGQASDGVDVQVNPTSLHVGDTPANVANENDTKEISDASDDKNGCESDSSKDAKVMLEEADLLESLEHIFPDNLFASPTKFDTEADANSPLITSSNYKAVLSSTSLAIGAAESAKSCHFQIPRFPSGQGVVEM